MLSKCFNPECSERFHRMGTGMLVSREELTQRRRAVTEKELQPEFFWLCSRCSVTFTLDFDRLTETVVLKPRFWYASRAS